VFLWHNIQELLFPEDEMARRKRTTTSVAGLLGMSFKKSTPLDFFRTFILFCALMVALVAIVVNAFDDNVRMFLVTVIMCAALTKGI
jgi:hypothetical protein